MPDNPPLAASRRYEQKRPRPIPKKVRQAIELMVFGQIDDVDCRPLDFVEAARTVGMRPHVLRRYLDRPAVIALIRSERRAFCEILCCQNEAALQKIRDTAANTMSRVAAIRELQAISAETVVRPSPSGSPGLVIRIIPATGPPPAALTESPRTIDVTPEAGDQDPRDRVFRGERN